MLRFVSALYCAWLLSVATAAQEDDPNLYRLAAPSLEVRFPASMTLEQRPSPFAAEYHAKAASQPDGTSALIMLLPRGEVKHPNAAPWPILEAIVKDIRVRGDHQIAVEGTTAVFVNGLPGLRYALIETANPHPVQFCQLLLAPDGIVSQLYGTVVMDRRVPAAAIQFFDSLRRPGLEIPAAYQVAAAGLRFDLEAGFLPRLQDEMVEISHPSGHGMLLSFEALPKPKSQDEELSELAQFIQRTVQEQGSCTIIAGPGPLNGGRGVLLRHESSAGETRHRLLWFRAETTGRTVLTTDLAAADLELAHQACARLVATLATE